VVVIALLVGREAGGIIGALLALPIAAALRMLIEELRVRHAVMTRTIRACAPGMREPSEPTLGRQPGRRPKRPAAVANRNRQPDS
jgi:hypothetical protein